MTISKGQIFGYWKILKEGPKSKHHKSTWLCLCTSCGKTVKLVEAAHLLNGKSTRCHPCGIRSLVTTRLEQRPKLPVGAEVGQWKVEAGPGRDGKWLLVCLACGVTKRRMTIKEIRRRIGGDSSICRKCANRAKDTSSFSKPIILDDGGAIAVCKLAHELGVSRTTIGKWRNSGMSGDEMRAYVPSVGPKATITFSNGEVFKSKELAASLDVTSRSVLRWWHAGWTLKEMVTAAASLHIANKRKSQKSTA